MTKLTILAAADRAAHFIQPEFGQRSDGVSAHLYQLYKVESLHNFRLDTQNRYTDDGAMTLEAMHDPTISSIQSNSSPVPFHYALSLLS
jgi:hypothetical protein